MNSEPGQSLSIALIGSGGAGVLTAGALLLDGAAAAGCYALMRRASGPQIRGGESAALLRIAARPVDCDCGHFEVLLALDWRNAERFIDEIKLREHGVVIYDDAAGPPPASLQQDGCLLVPLPLTETAKGVEQGRINMVGLGLLAALAGISAATMDEVIAKGLGRKGSDAVRAGQAAAAAGATLAAQMPHHTAPSWPAPAFEVERWKISGNEACGLGALRAGVRFCAAYPITPASEMLEWLAARLERLGGVLLQAEDELASINMCIGASFGGVPALTATSGPGFALMSEAMGLAVAAEVPVVVIDVMRGGPSTGIPTKSEQADLNIAVYGMHGDAPHLVLAPLSISDGIFTTQWAVHLAEALQVPAVVLSDQTMAQARAVIDKPADVAFMTHRVTAKAPAEDYQRYALVAGGVSPMAIPGSAGLAHTAEGLEHNQHGTPSASAVDHIAQLDKRRTKITEHEYGGAWAELSGTGDTAVITWGSTSAAVREALAHLENEGMPVRMIAVRLLSPFQEKAFAAAIQGVARVMIVEQSHGRQFYRYLRAHADLPADSRVLARPGPVPIRPYEIVEQLRSWR